MLAAGQRRMFNANQIFRDPAWRRDDPDGALLINPADLDALGASDGDWLAVESAVGRLVARCKADDSMRRSQLALPHGYGQSYPQPTASVSPTDRGSTCSPRVAIAIRFAGTPITSMSPFVCRA